MSNAFSGSSSRGAFSSAHAATTAPKHHGFLSNLLGDIRDAAVGLPQGFVNLAEHPIRSAEAIGKSTWHDWSPLFQGNFKEWEHNFVAHPLAPILDVAGLVTGGAGLLAKGGDALATAGLISKESKLAQLSGKASEASRAAHGVSGDSKLTKMVNVEGAPSAYRHFDANPVVRLRQRAQVSLGHTLAEHMPQWFGRVEHTAEDGTKTLKTGSVRDTTEAGFSDRYFRKHESYRAGATKAAMGAQLAAFVKAGKDITTKPLEMFHAVEDHGRSQLVEHAYRLTGEQARHLDTSRFTFVKNEAHIPYVKNVHDVEGFKNAMQAFAGRHTTGHMDQAAVDGEHYLVVHKRAAQAWGKEGVRSANFLTKLYKYPTQAWKYAILATRPAYFVNNAVGNTFMALASTGPTGFVRGLADAYRQVHGETKAAKDLGTAERALHNLHGDWQDKYYLGVHQGFGQEAMSQLRLADKVAGHPRFAKVVHVAEQGLYPITHKVSDLFLRRVMVNHLLRQHGAVQHLMRDEGMSFDKAAARVSKDPAVRDKIQEQVNNALGDYHHFNGLEETIRKIVPFYSWDRAIMRHGVHLALDRTGRTAVGAHIGEAGAQDTEKKLGGNLPDFLHGLVVLPGHGHEGRSKVLATQGLNPYASLPDVADALGALIGAGHANPGSTVASQVNPIITSAIETATGQSLLSGARLPRRPGGFVGQAASNLVEGLPHTQLLKTLIEGEAQPKANKGSGKTTPFLYRKDARTQIAALLGIPVKELDEATASALADKQNGVRKGRRKRIF